MPGLLLALFAAASAPVVGQVRTIDPNRAIDSDISAAPQSAPAQTVPQSAPAPVDPTDRPPADAPASDTGAGYGSPATAPSAAATADKANATREAESTYKRQDLVTAAEGVFGKGAQGLAGIIEKILKDQGQPNAYIAGREASGAFVVGARYGSGLMSHKVEGDLPVYWTGPSLGFDVGGNASKVFVLVYNLYDTQDIFRRYPEGEGHLYFVGGFSATYLRRGNIVLIPIRLGVGLRAGVNVGYMKFSRKAKWLPL
jgi:hypothetical protein